jgi:hypothetical protein
VLREKPLKSKVSEHQSLEDPDKHHLGNLMVLAHGHMRFGPK